MPDWYVVHTHPNAENKVIVNLRRQGFDPYLPLFRKRRSHAGKVDEVLRPLFPRYLFVAIDLATQRWRAILSTFGVVGLLRHGDVPTAVPRGVVDEIRNHERRGDYCESAVRVRMQLGQQVRVANGAFANMVGRFQGMDDAERVTLLLEMMGGEVRVRVPLAAVTADLGTS
ncbi:transcriptional antiterminator RfaH [uncultured Gammaproteobacteria bacterium]